MNALLLSAGLGVRLRPITNTVPKCLVEIHGVPLLEIWLNRIFYSGIARTVINLHYLAAPVRSFVKKSAWRSKVDLFDEPTLLGTGGTLRATRNMLGTGPFMVVHADNLSNIDLSALCDAHSSRPRNCLITMALFNSEEPQNCGIVECDEQKRVVALHEKVDNPPDGPANAAVYIFEQQVFQFIENIHKQHFDIVQDILPFFMGRIYTYKIGGYHRDIGNPTALAQAHKDIATADILDFIVSKEKGFNATT
jgi:mannose-1-phosphate guanylyltransferase